MNKINTGKIVINPGDEDIKVTLDGHKHLHNLLNSYGDLINNLMDSMSTLTKWLRSNSEMIKILPHAASYIQ